MLNRDKILDASLELVDRDGPRGLTMRALAHRLHVTPTAIYHYFAGRDDLVEAVLDRTCAAIVGGVPGEGRWDRRLRALAVSLVEHSVAHPAVVNWAVTSHARRRPVLRIDEAILGLLAEAGFGPEAALHAKGTVLRYCIGHLVLHGLPEGEDWGRLPAGAFPHCRAAGSTREGLDGSTQFDRGLEAVLTGLAAGLLAAPRGATA
jgi:AcrR family transcriptional regulator